jgi:ABC-type Zn uptake system ZnuABC Zn-binding protein ZnuA
VAFQAELSAAHAEAQARIATIPAARRRLVTPHDTFRYFARAYGLQVVNIPGLASGQEPRPAALERLIDMIHQLRVPAVFFESTANARTLRTITGETSTKTVTTLVAEGLGPEGSPTGTYLGMFRANVDAIVAALK